MRLTSLGVATDIAKDQSGERSWNADYYVGKRVVDGDVKVDVEDLVGIHAGRIERYAGRVSTFGRSS